MERINGIGLTNVRVFNNHPIIFKLTPLTILTGPNSSGKSTIVKSLMLFKDLDTTTWPYRLKLDGKNNELGSYELIKNNNTGKDEIPGFYFRLFVPILNENITIAFFASKSEKPYELRIERMTIINGEDTILFDFQTDKNDNFIFNVNYLYFKDKIVEIINKKERYSVLKNIADKAIRTNEKGFSIIDENGFKEQRLKAIKNGLQIKEFQQLNMFYENKKYERAKDFKLDEFIFNYKYLNTILRIPKDSLNTLTLKDTLLNTAQDQNIKKLVEADKIPLDAIVEILHMHDYKDFEKKQLSEISKSYRIIDSYAYDGLYPLYSRDNSIFSLLGMEDLYPFHPFYAALSELEKNFEIVSGVFVSSKREETEFSKISDFSKNVFIGIMDIFKYDIKDVFRLSLGKINPERIIDYGNSLHELISSQQKSGRIEFINKWLKEFNICDKIVFETPVAGLGYSIYLKKRGKKVPLYDEGRGTNHILNIILGINNLYLPKNDYDFNLYSWLEERCDYFPRTVLIEEPEANLHPAWQSKLADLFVEASEAFGLNFIIETHSEYLIRKLQNLVARKALRNDLVQIIYFDNQQNNKRVSDKELMYSIKIKEDGTLSRGFGPGFFDEADNLAIELLSIYNAQKN